MKYTRSRSVAFILYWLILATFIQVITQIPSVAATGDPWELTTIADELTAQEETPSMIFQPDGPVRTLSDLAPTGTKVTELPVDWAETVTPVKIEIDETADVALGFGGNEVGLVIEPNTFTETVDIEFTPVARDETAVQDLSTLPITGTTTITTLQNFIYPQTRHFLEFQLEATRASDSGEVEQFEKPLRLTIDVRSFGFDTDAGGSFFLAYADEANPGEWIEVPITQYQSDGLFSAEVTHFSDWSTGWRPEAWVPQWHLPTVSTFSGAATYQYPLQLPPGRHGLQPNLALAYSSSALNGAILEVGLGPIATGWSTDEVSIIRTGVKIAASGNQYQYPDKFRLVLHGAGHKLFASEVSGDPPGRYYVENAPSVYVQFHDSEDYWTVKTGDGTEYRLGYEAQARNTHQYQFGSNDPQPLVPKIIAWHVDRVTDTFGNKMVYAYDNSNLVNGDVAFWCGGPCVLGYHTHKSHLQEITYNFDAAGLAASRITFTYDNGVDPRVPWYLTDINTYHGNGTIPVRTYHLEASNIDVGNGNGCRDGDVNGRFERETTTRILNSITEYNYDWDWQNSSWEPLSLPPVEFGYETFHHYHESGQGNCFKYKYLKSVANGYGGVTEFDYGDNGRVVGDFAYTNWVQVAYPSVGYNYRVENVIQHNGMGDDYSIAYAYADPCYNQTTDDGSGPVCPQPGAPEFGNIGGYHQVSVTTMEGSQALNRQYILFHNGRNYTNLDYFGKTKLTWSGFPQSGDTMNIDRSQEYHETLTRYTSEDYANIGKPHPVSFVYAERVEKRQRASQYGLVLSSMVAYEYDIQYGNVTHIRNYDYAANNYPSSPPSPPVRTTLRTYHPNTIDWLVSLPASETAYEGDTSTEDNIRLRTWNYYDSNSNWATPPGTQGAVSRIRQLIQKDNCTNCTHTFDTVESTFAYDTYGNPVSQTTFREPGTVVYNSAWVLTTNNLAPTTPATTTNIDFDDGRYHLYPLSITGADGTTTSFEIYGFNGVPLTDEYDSHRRYHPGLLKRVIDPNDIATRYEYDFAGRLTGVDNYDDGSAASLDAVTTYFDSPSWRNDGFLNPGSGAPLLIANWQRLEATDLIYRDGIWGRTFYDGLGRVIETQASAEGWISGDDNTHDIVQYTIYDALGRATEASVPYEITAYVWDENDPLTPYVAPDTNQATTETEYDDLGRVTQTFGFDDNLASHSHYGFTSEGSDTFRYVDVMDGNHHRLQHRYDALGRLVKVIELSGDCGNYWGYNCGNPPNTWATYATTTYGYDYMGNLEKVTDADTNITDITYDNLGRKTSMTDPDMGDWFYEYDISGNLVGQTDELGQALCFYYDTLNRLIRKIDGTGAACPGYGSTQETDTNHLASYYYYGPNAVIGSRGQLQKVSWGSQPGQNNEAFAYDNLGRLDTHTRLINNRAFIMRVLTYDVSGRPLTVLYPDGETLTYTYDRQGEESLTAGTDTIVDTIKFNEQGQMDLLSLGNNLDTFYKYFGASGNYRLDKIIHGNAGNDNPGQNALPDFLYQYDAVGNISEITTKIAGVTDDVQQFEYGHLNRLLTAVASSGVENYDYTYTYDEIGNINSITKQGTLYDYNYNSTQPHAVDSITGGSSDSFIYDANGNMTSREEGNATYTQDFDVENRLITVIEGSSITEFRYDANGQRTMTLQPGGLTTTYYPFPGYEETVTEPGWADVALTATPTLNTSAQPDWHLASSDTAGWALDTNDQPGWGLAMTEASDWANDLMPWSVETVTATADTDFPASSLYHGPTIGDTFDGQNTPSNHALTVSNLASGILESDAIEDEGNTPYDLSLWVNHRFNHGSFSIQFVPYEDTPITIWTSETYNSQGIPGGSGWEELEINFTTSSKKTGAFTLRLIGSQIDGWVAWDNLTLSRTDLGVESIEPPGVAVPSNMPVLETSFEGSYHWIEIADSAFPATSFWNGGSEFVMAQDGQKSYIISNLIGESSLTSPLADVTGMTDLQVEFWLQSSLQVNSSPGGLSLTIRFYDDENAQLGEVPLWHSDSLTNTDEALWRQITVSTSNIPSHADSAELNFATNYVHGWLGIDDVTVKNSSGATLVSWDMNNDTWTDTNDSDFPAGTVWHDGSVGHNGSGGYLFTQEAQAAAVSDYFSVLPYGQYKASAWLRGQMDSDAGQAQVWVHFYDESEQAVGTPVLVTDESSLTPSWQGSESNILVPGSATQVQFEMVANRIGGWVAFDNLALLDLNEPIPWYVSNSWSVVSDTADFPATSSNNAGALGDPYSVSASETATNNPAAGNGRAISFNNLATGAWGRWITVPTNGPNSQSSDYDDYSLTLQINNAALDSGQVSLQVGYNDSYTGIPSSFAADHMLTIWDGETDDNWLAGIGWRTITTKFQLPDGTPHFQLRLAVTDGQGAVAFDELEVQEGAASSNFLKDEFDTTPTNWTALPDPTYPATALWQGSNGLAAPYVGQYSLAVGNVARAALASPWVAVTDTMSLNISFSVSEQLARGKVTALARYVDTAAGETIVPLWDSSSLTGSGWQTVSLTYKTPPAGSIVLQLIFLAEEYQGWLGLDDVIVMDGTTPIFSSDMETDNWNDVPDDNYPGSTVWYGTKPNRVNEEISDHAYVFSNEGSATAHSSLFLAQPGKTYHIEAQVRGVLTVGEASGVHVSFFDENGVEIGDGVTVWGTSNLNDSQWQEVGGLFTMPITATHFRLDLEADRIDGYVAFDAIEIANVSEPILAGPNHLYDLAAAVRGQMTAAELPATGLKVYYYDSGGNEIGSYLVWGSHEYESNAAEIINPTVSGRFTTLANTASFRLGLMASMDNDTEDGWVDYDDITLTTFSSAISVAVGHDYRLSAQVKGELDGESGTTAGRLALHLFDSGSAFAKQLAIQDVWQVSDYAQPSTYATQSGTVTPNGGSHLRVGLTVRLDEGWLSFQDITLSSFSQVIAVDKDNDYTLSAQITGNIQVSGGSSGGKIIIHNNLGGQQSLWNGTNNPNGSVSAGPMNVPTNGGVDSIWLETQVVLDKGHLTFEQLNLKILGLPVTVTDGQTYGAAIRVKGSLTAPSGEKAVQLGVYNSSGNTLLHPLWEKRNYHNTQAWQVQGSSFSEANNNTVRLGVMVNLDRGWLAFDGPIWTQFSPMVSDPAMNVDSAYLMTTTLNISNQQVSSQLSVQFYNSGGNAVGAPILLADTGNAGSGVTTVTAAFLPPEDATQMRFMSQAQVASGSLTYTVDELVRQVHASHIVRSTYYLVGKAIATRVAGDPEARNNGLFFFHGDHLGSASAMSYGFDDPTTTSTNELGTWMDGTLTRYLPFGEYRTEPTAELTELGYTGHHENRDIGLTYMNARFYVPTLSRFLSADTIVSDPTDPQTWNRYSYTLNNPVKFIDPTGHCASDGSTEAEACWYYLENLFCYDIDCGSNGWKDWIIVNDDSIWTMKELWDVHESLAAVKSALQSLGIDWLHTTMSGVNFSRYAGAGLSDGAIGRYTRSTHEIILTDSAFNDRTILHELGHAIDTYSPFRDLHDRYAVESGSCVICKIGKGFYFREYGRAPQTEGWADAFSAWVYQHKEGKNPSNDAWLGVDASLEPFVDWGGIYQAVEKVLKEEHVILSPTTITVPSKSHVRIPSPL